MSAPQIPVSQLLTPISQDQFRSTFVNVLVTVGIPANLWRAGGVASTILTALAATCAGFSTIMVDALSAMFLEYASGSWLILLAYYVYGVNAIPATFASGKVLLSNSGGGVYSYGVGQFTVLNTVTGKTYTNQDAFSLNGISTALVTFQCTVSGTTGNAAPGQINATVTTALGVTCTNSGSVVGTDAQSDDSLKATCQAALGARSVRGPRTAYQYAVQTALNGGVPVNINRIAVSTASSTGVVNVYCASPSGAPTSGDLDAAAAAVEEIARPDGATAFVNSVSLVSDTDAITVYARALPGLTAATVQAAAAAGLAEWLSQYPIGGLVAGLSQGLFASGVDGVIYATNSAIFAVTGTTDHALTNGQVITNNTTITVTLVAP